VAAATVAIAHEPPETTPLVDDEDVELGVCVGCWRLEVDEEVSLELVVDEPVSGDVDDDVEFDGEPVE
jgi:hypothetical protein